MFCKNCGKDIELRNKKCPHCGEETDFLSGIDGSDKPKHLKDFEKQLNLAISGKSVRTPVAEEDTFEDISSYQTTNKAQEDKKEISNNYVEKPLRSRSYDTYDDEAEKSSQIWRIMASVCIVVIIISLIVIFAVSCSSKKDVPQNDTTTPATTMPATTVAPTTEPTTTVPTTEKPMEEYLESAVVDDTTAIETVQGFYSNIESACASGDFETFKSYFGPSYSETEIKKIYDDNQTICSQYSTFIPGITTTVSCDKFIYVYIAATTNLETNDYVEHTFVLSSDNGAFKLDKSDAAAAWLSQAPTKLS